MHRSGTSFLGECCGALGYALPRDSGGPADDNPRGHFEPQAVVALNEAILASRGAVWNRVGPLDLPPAQAAALATNETLVARLARIERFETAAEAPKGAVTLTVGGATFCLPLAEVIDIAAMN